MQYLASNNCTFNLDGFADKATGQGKLINIIVWSFWSWFDVNQSTFDEDMIDKLFLHFRS